MKRLLSTLVAAVAFSFVPAAHAADVKLLNVSYDPTRELYEEINKSFIASYTADKVTIDQSHGGSSKQARAVLDGLEADVVTLGLGGDIRILEKGGLVAKGWEDRLPNHASPYTSTFVFLVRKGNPKQVKDWGDLIKPGVQSILPNPKTSGGARWGFVAAYAFGGGIRADKLDAKVDEAAGREFVTKLYKQVPVLDTGARGSTVTFAQKNIGDVLITWENEAWLTREEFGEDKFEIVYPSVTIIAEPPVAVVDKVVDKKGTRAAAEAYLKFLYTPAAQKIIAQNHYRPADKAIADEFSKDLPPIPAYHLEAVTPGGWDEAQPKFFGDGGVFDQVYAKK